jgi:hypothetical protein
MTNTKTDRFAAVRQKMAEIKKEMLKIGQEAFAEESKRVFVDFPTLQAFAWVQFTPYFMDGDTCTFSVDNYDFWLKLEGMSELVRGGYDCDEHDEEIVDVNHALIDTIEATLREFIGSIDDDVMLAMFGDHAKIVVDRDGSTTVEEYDHD